MISTRVQSRRDEMFIEPEIQLETLQLRRSETFGVAELITLLRS